MANVTWNPLNKGSLLVLSNNNLTVTCSGIKYQSVTTTDYKSSTGKWYWEIKMDNWTTSNYGGIGVANASYACNSSVDNDIRTNNNIRGLFISGDSTVPSSYYPGNIGDCGKVSTGDVLGLALDLDNNTLAFYKNGILKYTASGIKSLGSNIYPFINMYASCSVTANFGTTPFTYTIPSGFKAYVSSSKYLIKQNSNYYTINSANYDSTTNHNFTALTLTGGTLPNKSDIETFGFDDLSLLTTNMTVESDTFIPLDKLNNQFDIKMYAY